MVVFLLLVFVDGVVCSVVGGDASVVVWAWRVLCVAVA